MARPRRTCCVCGKRKLEANGWFYTVKYLQHLNATIIAKDEADGRVYGCFRCIRKLEKSNSPFQKAIREIVEDAKKDSSSAEHDLRLLKDALKPLCKGNCWVRIQDVAEGLNKLQRFHYTGRGASMLLRRFGFTQRRQGAQNYTYVFIEQKALGSPPYTPPRAIQTSNRQQLNPACSQKLKGAVI